MDVYEWLAGNVPVLRYVLAVVVFAIFFYLSKVAAKQVSKLKIVAAPEILHNIERVVRVAVVAVGGLTALSVAGVDLGGLLVAAGFAGLVVGLAAQQTLSSLFAGLTLLLEGRVKVGDSVRIGSDWGLVEAIGIMTTQIRLWSGEVVTIPNSAVVSGPIYNYSRSIARRAEIGIGISYSSDIDRAIEIVRAVLWENELVLAEPEPVVIVDSLGESSINLKILFWTPSQEFWTVRRTVIRDIKKALESAGIEIPYPQRVVWLRELR